MNSFLIEGAIDGETYLLSGEEHHHLKNVLRMKKGDTLYLTSRNGKQYEGIIAMIHEDGTSIEGLKEVDEDRESPVRITLAQGLLKGDKMDLVIQKCVELGVYEITPLSLTNCVVQLDEKNKEKKKSKTSDR